MDFFLLPEMSPFTFFAVMVVAFLILEIALMAIGIDTHLREADIAGPDLDASFEPIEATALPNGMEIPEGLEVEVVTQASTTSTGGLLDILGMRQVSLTIWMALFSAIFSSLGIVGQSLNAAVYGAPAPAWVGVAAILLPALYVTRAAAMLVGQILPQMETSAISERSFGRQRGVVTVGVARRGLPAEVRFTDSHGNLHYLRAEPLEDAAEIPQGSEVLILRVRSRANPKPAFRLIPLS